jgi:NADH-quinone oxidoreductase subunit L
MVFRRTLRRHLRPPGDGAWPLLLEAGRRSQIIDRFGPHGAAYAVGVGNRITARLQSGYVYSYALVMLLGLIGAATWVFWWVR